MSALTDRYDVTMTGLDDVREAAETTTASPPGSSPDLLGVTGGGPATAAGLVDGPWLEELLGRVTGSGVRLTGEGGFLPELIRAVLERGLAVELADHLGYEKGDPAGRGSPNSRNGSTPKTVLTEVGPVGHAETLPHRPRLPISDPESRPGGSGLRAGSIFFDMVLILLAQTVLGVPVGTPCRGVRIGGGCPPTSSLLGLAGRQTV